MAESIDAIVEATGVVKTYAGKVAVPALSGVDLTVAAGGATALFIAGAGAVGYGTRRDISALARYFFWALVAQIVADFAGGYDPAGERCWIAERDGAHTGALAKACS